LWFASTRLSLDSYKPKASQFKGTKALALMKLIILIFTALFALVSSEIETERELSFLVNPNYHHTDDSQSGYGEPVDGQTAAGGGQISASLTQEGYTNEFTSTCILRFYGTPTNTAAGDRDMRRIAKSFKSQFNKISKKVANGKYTRRLGKERKTQVNQEKELPIRMTEVEIDKQMLGTAARRTRRLGQGERNLWVRFTYAYIRSNYICRFCTTDDKDGRRFLEQAMAEHDFVGGVVGDLEKEKDSSYIQSTLQTDGCVQVSCDGGAWYSGDGCEEYSDE
jgi:hypothetical protein